jgi:uncharacterized DUF497 family protein
MVQPSKFKWLEFEWDEYNLEELAAHHLQLWEAEECFYNQHQVFRNKRRTGRKYETFKLIGRSNAGRSILLIFFVKSKRSIGLQVETTALIRVITGWEN